MKDKCIKNLSKCETEINKIKTRKKNIDHNHRQFVVMGMGHGVNCVVMGWHVIRKIVMVLFFSETSSESLSIFLGYSTRLIIINPRITVISSNRLATCASHSERLRRAKKLYTCIAARLRVEWAGLGRETVN